MGLTRSGVSPPRLVVEIFLILKLKKKIIISIISLIREYSRGKYHCIVDLFDWFGLVCFGNKNTNCQLSYR